MDTIEQSQKSGVEQGMKLVKAFRSTTPYAPGRRPFFQYRDLGLEAYACRPASADDLAAAHSSWGRRLLSSGRDRRSWLIELAGWSA